MSQGLKYFIWGWQRSFSIDIEFLAKRLFKLLDQRLAPHVFLVGLLHENRTDRFPICVEPEDCGYSPDVFRRAPSAAQELAANDPEHNVLHSHPIAQAGHEKRIENRGWSDSVRNALLAVDGENYEFFVSFPRKIDGFTVLIVLRLVRKVFESLPTLQNGREPISNHYPVLRSLTEAAAIHFLDHCSEELSKRDPGNPSAIQFNEREILHRAARRFMATPASAANDIESMYSLFERCTTISSLKYEQGEAAGSLIIAKKGDPDLEFTLKFARSTKAKDFRATRKLLELSSAGLKLVADNSGIVGLGRISDSYDRDREAVFEVRFTAFHQWELRHAGEVLMSVTYGEPRLPSRLVEPEVFRSIARRLFKESRPNLDLLWGLTERAAQQRHGTMLVVSDHAEQESKRLEKQSTSISETVLTLGLLDSIASIDGAILLRPDGMCFAIGVILDGIASENGDSARGARYNSAVRYVESVDHACLCVVVSEDATVDLVPHLRPQISKTHLEDIVNDLELMAEQEAPISPRRYSRVLDAAYDLSFYWSAEDCGKLNRVRESIDQRMREEDPERALWIKREDLVPDPDMSDEYLLP